MLNLAREGRRKTATHLIERSSTIATAAAALAVVVAVMGCVNALVLLLQLTLLPLLQWTPAAAIRPQKWMA
jgi:hypothetical protein